ncbi:pyridoxamine 5'-phosphate oxidase family protein [Luteipulveratus flavus]|uniref:Pyridoxamine 5'-phosphate oxidase family protein n=1 Tax=Luteipulveratus flavus TaxID=3031728 RepID=A0ABT6C372_9MICO|nr:pyridoxamine 5'-phosphate oxidase family protein [Luteipulveratus sp. YIM 133296]MDF8263401.1 pyridoxamine 5'-phosphate oxidase family protein [Luteipulveratus sp. YIM 133296]
MTSPRGSLDTRFSDPVAHALGWPEVVSLLTSAELYWLTTVRSDGRPHTCPLVGVWAQGAFSFCTGTGEQKHANLEHRADVSVTTGANTWTEGTDVVVEGRAERVRGRERLALLAAAWRDKYGDQWAWQADDEGFHDDGEQPGSRPWVYVVPPAKVIAFGKRPHSQTTFRF